MSPAETRGADVDDARTTEGRRHQVTPVASEVRGRRREPVMTRRSPVPVPADRLLHHR